MNEVLETLGKITIGDKLAINDWHAKYTVCGMSPNFIVARYGNYYTIISRNVATENYNRVREGDVYCGPDWWIFGYSDGYDFRNREWVEKYLTSLEIGETEIGRKREPVWFLSIVGHIDNVYAKEKAP